MRLALARHLVAIAVLPFTVTVLVPRWLLGRFPVPRVADVGDGGALAVAAQLAGVVALAVGLTLFVASLRRFATEGEGTLAPWDPPRALVVRGPYRHVRNPMISGVIFVLVGEALVLLSRDVGWWAAIFAATNAAYIPLFEEPGLERRFGDAYREYRRHVRRFVPRLRPWTPA
jgi:protein-S-isoprenylcysteine O-methyltransferase Ste14